MGSRSWARGHVGGNPQTFEISDAYYRVPAAGGINGSIQDLAIWMLANMGLAPDVLTPGMLQQVQTARINTPGENRRRARFRERTATTQYGLGWRILDYAGHRVIGHHGGVKGYRSMIMFDPALKSGVVVLWNSASARPNGIEYEVMDMVYHLPFHDWLFTRLRPGGAAPEAESEERGGARTRCTAARMTRAAAGRAGAKASARGARGPPRSADGRRRGARPAVRWTPLSTTFEVAADHDPVERGDRAAGVEAAAAGREIMVDARNRAGSRRARSIR